MEKIRMYQNCEMENYRSIVYNRQKDLLISTNSKEHFTIWNRKNKLNKKLKLELLSHYNCVASSSNYIILNDRYSFYGVVFDDSADALEIKEREAIAKVFEVTHGYVASFSKNNKFLIIISKPYAVVSVWEVGTWKLLGELLLPGYVVDYSLSDDGRYLALLFEDSFIVLDLKNMKVIYQGHVTRYVRQILFTKKNKLLVITTSQKPKSLINICVHDILKKQVRAKIGLPFMPLNKIELIHNDDVFLLLLFNSSVLWFYDFKRKNDYKLDLTNESLFNSLNQQKYNNIFITDDYALLYPTLDGFVFEIDFSSAIENFKQNFEF